MKTLCPHRALCVRSPWARQLLEEAAASLRRRVLCWNVITWADLSDEMRSSRGRALSPPLWKARSFSERSATLRLEWELGWSFLFIVWVVNTWDRCPHPPPHGTPSSQTGFSQRVCHRRSTSSIKHILNNHYKTLFFSLGKECTHI